MPDPAYGRLARPFWGFGGSVTDDFEITTVDPARQPSERADILALLAKCDLDYELGVEAFVTFRLQRRLIACIGLEANIVKCTAIDPTWRGEALGLKLVTEVENLACDRGISHLFAYTNPNNLAFFRSCGFYLLAEVPHLVALLENTPVGIRSYCDSLKRTRHDGPRIGSIVMNANPFTYGHRYLIEHAASACDWLHVFAVGEDASFISYRDRFALMQAGMSDFKNVTLHPGSEYILSRATFSAYFFKEKGIIGDCFTAIDLLVFRNHIAPALGITHRFVGTEPFCTTTNKYNRDMQHWLCADSTAAPPIEVVEIERRTLDGVPISASEVRSLLAVDDFERIARLAPPATVALLRAHYRQKQFSTDETMRPMAFAGPDREQQRMPNR